MTSAPFVSNLRSRKSVIRLAPAGAEAITIRVEMPEVWDVVRMEVLASDQVLEVKTRALQAFVPGEAGNGEEFIVKLRGWEILDETASLADAGVIDGSILLLTHRRRRPVR